MMSKHRQTKSALLILLLTVGLCSTGLVAQVTPADDDGTPANETPVNNGESGQETDQNGDQDQDQEQQQTQEDKPGMFESSWPLLIMLGGFVVLYIIMGRGRRKQQQKRKEMLETLKKGDKVITIGGIQGTVMDVKGNEITVKVDETNNIRMKFARWSVQSVGEEPSEQGPHEQR